MRAIDKAQRQGDGRFTGDAGAVSARMRLIRSQGTKPELIVFEALERAGIDYVAHPKVLNIRVDALVAPRIVIFVDSPFWHMKDRETLGRLNEYWQSRLLANHRRDRVQTRALTMADYFVLRFWSDEIRDARVVRRVAAAMARSRKAAEL